MLETIAMNNEWLFTKEYSEDLKNGEVIGKLEKVRIPHTVTTTPFHYFDESTYEMVSGYARILHADPDWKGKRVFIKFCGIAHGATVFLNGEQLGEHHCGYTAFEVELTDHLKFDQDNWLVVRVDSRESQNIPPFGFVIDYLTYGGIYREVELIIRDASYLDEVFVKPLVGEDVELPGANYDGRSLGQRLRDFQTEATIETEFVIRTTNPAASYRVQTTVLDSSGHIVGQGEETVSQVEDSVQTRIKAQGVFLWDVIRPRLYDLELVLWEDDRKLDTYHTRIGFRVSEFRKNGYYLNGRKLKIRGLNRHQSYPYVGYAMPKSIQRMDADVLRLELGLNAVRTSHYPQSQHFIDRCDELGLLVFTEIPGWQHIGDASWKEQAYVNVSEMITQYRNHPSVILWGVRINESLDDDNFYQNTNDMAHALDETRPTGGVRYLKNSHLLEDVYTYNDFIHDGTNQGCDKRSVVTSEEEKPYLITEYNGHMYPTKSFDSEPHRLSHAIRHANVLDSVSENTDIAGSFGWCMADYNTHKDFGSGDKICYHGVLDMFRNPKMAAAVYSAHQKRTAVLEVSSSMDIGEHPASIRHDVYIFTNADSVKMYRNDHFIKEFTHENSPYKHMKRGPIRIDDYVGDLLIVEEGYDEIKSRRIKEVLNYIASHGMNHIPATMMVKIGHIMTRYHMKFSDALDLYQKYVGNWGAKSTVYRFEAIKDGEIVKTVTKTTMSKCKLEVTASRTKLEERETYDVAAIRVRVTDEYGNVQPFFNTDLEINLRGPIELIGPKMVHIDGGMGGTYVKSIGELGTADIEIRFPQGTNMEEESKKVEFVITN